MLKLQWALDSLWDCFLLDHVQKISLFEYLCRVLYDMLYNSVHWNILNSSSLLTAEFVTNITEKREVIERVNKHLASARAPVRSRSSNARHVHSLHMRHVLLCTKFDEAAREARRRRTTLAAAERVARHQKQIAKRMRQAC